MPKERDSLSGRELEVLCLVAQGLNDARIGEHLCIATQTASNHVGRIREKLRAATRAEAVAIAFAQGIMPPPRIDA